MLFAKRMRTAVWVCLALICRAGLTHAAAPGNEPLLLVQNGTARAVILTPAAPSKMEQYAAEYLARGLHRISGGTFPVVTEANAGPPPYSGPVISLGRTALAGDLPMQGPAWKQRSPEAFRLLRRDTALIICGNQAGEFGDYGTLWGVYAFLERQGLGSYLHYPLGEVVPDRPTLTVTELDLTDAPWFRMRGGGSALAQLQRYDPGGDLVQYLPDGRDGELVTGVRSGTRKVEFYHMYQYLITPEVRQAHPDWFEHTHNPRYGPQPSAAANPGQGGSEAGICLSNPGLRDFFVEHFRARFRQDPDLYAATICPDDYLLGDRCSCADCQRLMNLSAPPTYTVRSPRSSSDLQIDFVNAIAAALEPEFPDRKLVTYAYLDYMDAPTVTRVHPNVIIMIAPLDVPDELHPGLDRIVKGWRRMGAQTLYWYGYILGRPPVPSLLGEWFRKYRDWGIDGVYLEFTPGIAAFTALNSWLYRKLMWNPAANVQDLVDEFCTQLFGPELGSLMRRLFLAWELRPPFADEDAAALLTEIRTRAAAAESPIPERTRLFTLAYEIWNASHAVDDALKRNDDARAAAVAARAVAAAEELRREFPGWALNQNVAGWNCVGWCELQAALPALEKLASSPVPEPQRELPLPGPVRCLTGNADIPAANRVSTNVRVPNLDAEDAAKLFDGKFESGKNSLSRQGPLLTVDLDLGRPLQLDRVEICNGTTRGHSCLVLTETVPIYVDIQVSTDGAEYRTVDRVLPRTLPGFVSSRTLLVTARYLRLVAASLNYRFQLDEVRVWGRATED